MAGKHVLIVDDDTEFVKLYSLFLRNKGLKVSAVYSASEALGAIESLAPDIVVLDVMMEHFDSGFNASKSIKEKNPGMPIILMTAIGEETGLDFKPKTPEDHSMLHADAFLDKEASPEELLARILDLIG
ncbi:MAG: response regulator [Candidatus Eisenbacteria bacterium]|nr:response regulator [Candidatus Eisenbacteria bacterium]